MDFNVKTGSPAKQRTDCVIVGVFEGKRLSEAADLVNKASRGRIRKLLDDGELSGKLGETATLHNVSGVTAQRVLLVGCGKVSKFDSLSLRRVTGDAIRALRSGGSKQAISYLGSSSKQIDAYWAARHGAESAAHACYEFREFKAKKPSKSRLNRVTIGLLDRGDSADSKRGLAHAAAIAAGASLARDLGNRPANHCTPNDLAAEARTLAKRYTSITTKVLSEVQMQKLGMGVLLSVAQGTEQPAKLIVMEYKGGNAKQPPHALVGKGVTFDTGGISLKPAPDMDEMKYDMCGAASVFGTLRAVAELELPMNVVGIVPATENMPGGRATKPGDIFTSMSGKTVEVLNTDAEGRLILSDALSYAARYKPESVIDIATLTGACVIALGDHATGLMSNNQDLADALLEAGTSSGDRAWQLPLWDEYQKQIDSPFADIANIGGRSAGTITAACFLSRFTEDYRWAHLDIAGTAWVSGKNKSATGRPVGLLVQYLINQA